MLEYLLGAAPVVENNVVRAQEKGYTWIKEMEELEKMLETDGGLGETPL